MEIKLAEGWVLTDQYGGFSYGLPVLVDMMQHHVYGPGDIININGENVPSVRVVDRFLADMKELSADEIVFVRKFFLG